MNGRGNNNASIALGRDPYSALTKGGSSNGGRSNGGRSDDKFTLGGRPDPKLDLQNPTSIFRENLRLRVREDEKRLGALIRQRGGDYFASTSDESKSGSDNVERDYGRTMMRGNGDADSFLYEKLLDIEEGFSKQAKRIRVLEIDLSDRDDEIKTLRSEIVKKLRRIVELELEIKSMAQIDEDLLSLTGEQLYDIDLEGSFRDNDGRGVEVQRAKLMVAKLMADLRNLEARYKEDQLKASRSIEELRLENSELRDNKSSMVVDLEKRVLDIEAECVRLGRSVEVKDRQIDNLKRELSTYRLNQLSGRSGSGDGRFSEFDRDLLRSTPNYYEGEGPQRNRDEVNTRRYDSDDRDVLRSQQPSFTDRERESASYRTRSASPGRNIRFAENLEDDAPLSKTKESQLELIRQSRMRSGSFDRSAAGRDSNALTEDDVFPRSGERGRAGYAEASGRRSANLRAVKQDQEQAIQRAKSNGLFGRAGRRLFGRG